MSKSQFIKDNNNKLFNATVYGVSTLEDWPKVSANLLEQVKAQGFTATVTEDRIRLNNGQVFSKPKLRKHYTATIEFRSTTYIATRDEGNSYGDTPPASNFTDNGFRLDMFGGGYIDYKLAN
jgi:hypothetical protein